MFKPVHSLQGWITSALTALNTAVFVDEVSYALLQRKLGAGNHTYAVIKNSAEFEVVKITAVGNGMITIVRAQDGTTATPFATGAEIEFVMGAQAIQEIISTQIDTEVTLEGGGMVTVTKVGPNHYTVFAPEVTLASETDQIIVGGNFPNFVLSTPTKQGCCG